MNRMKIKQARLVRIAVLTLVGAVMLSTAGAALAAKRDYERAISIRALNMADMQRMLTQKMSKEFLLVALGIQKNRHINDLRSTRELFARMVIGLRDGDVALGLMPTTDPTILDELNKVDELWTIVDPAIQKSLDRGKVTAHQVAVVADLNMSLLDAVSSAVLAYERKANANTAFTLLDLAIKQAGRQRMLIQKMSKEVLLIAYGHDEAINRSNLAKSIAHFSRTLMGLIHGDGELRLLPAPTPEIKLQLRKVERLWDEFRPSVERAAEGAEVDSEIVTKVAKINIPLLKAMNMAVFMYEAL